MSIINQFQTYVDQNYDTILNRAVLGAKSAKLFKLQTGVKTQTALNLLQTSVVLQSGSDCGWNAAGTSTVSQRTISALPIKVNQEFCEKTFLNTVAQHKLRIAAGDNVLPFEAEFIDDVLRNVALQSENLIYQGDTSRTDGSYLGFSDGLIKIAASDVPSGNKVGDGSAITINNVKAQMDLVYAAIPAEILDNAKILVGYDTFRLYTMALQALNLFHYDPSTSSDSMKYPGSVVTIEAVPGLNGTGCIFGLNPDTIFYGTDLMGDYEKFKFWYSDDFQIFKLLISFTQGIQIAFPDQVIYRPFTGQLVAASAPTITGIVGGAGKATISFTPAYDGGAAITGYKVSSDGGSTYGTKLNTLTSPIVVNLSTNVTPYSIKIKAVTAFGDGTASNAVSVTVS